MNRAAWRLAISDNTREFSEKSRLPPTLGALTAAIGVINMVGWHARIPTLTYVYPGFESMKYNTALGFVLMGLGLMFTNGSRRTPFLTGFVGLLALLTQLQDVMNLDFGLDQFMMTDYLASGTLHPGRMSTLTAICFMLTGAALYLANVSKSKIYSMLASILSSIALALSITALLGYLTDIETAYRLGTFTRMALLTPIAFIILSAGIIALVWARENLTGIPESAPLTIFVFFAIIAFRLWQILDITEQHNHISLTLISLNLLMGIIMAVGIIYFRNERLHSIEITKLSYAVEQSPASIVMTDTAGTIQYVNKRFCQLTGYSKEEALGKNPRILKSGKQPQKFYRELWETILTGNEWRGEFHNKRKDGALYWENALISPIKKADGKITHFIAIKEDITEKKRNLESLLASEEKYRLLFNACPDAIIIIDNFTRQILDANEVALELHQYSRDEFMALSLTDISNDHACCAYQFSESEVNALRKLPLHSHKRKDGSTFPMESTQGVLMVNNRPLVFCIGRDAGPRIERERKLLAAERNLKTSEKLASLGTLMAGICHETLNPVNIISMQVQMMLKKDKDNPVLAEKLSKIMLEVKRIVKIMSTFMIFSRKPSTDLPCTDLPCAHIEAEIESVLNLVESDFFQSNIAIIREFSDSLPKVNIDSDEIRQTLINLVNNAKYAMPNGGKLTIATRARTEENKEYLEIKVSDTGCGIKQEYLTSIFDPFFTTKPEGEGTGMGLAIAYGIIAKHGGNLSVESEEGSGSTFLISLPACTIGV